MDGAAGEGGENKAMGKSFMGCEAKVFGRWFRHDEGVLSYHAAGLFRS